MSSNAAERAIRLLTLGRKNYLFAGSDDGGRRAAIMYTLIETARFNDIDPEAWLADIIARIADHPINRNRRSPSLEVEASCGKSCAISGSWTPPITLF